MIVLYDIEALVIVLVSAMLIIMSVRNYRQYKRWYDLLLLGIGLAWATIFTLVLFHIVEGMSWFGQTFIRPMIWLTISALIAIRNSLSVKEKILRGNNGHK